MSQYHYSPLDYGKIRLLRLLSYRHHSTAKIQCEILDYNLQDSSELTHFYDALSYVWGDPEDTLPISVVYKAGLYELPVTTNLHAALLRLRNFSFDRIIWIDAICINQKDQQEKESQILLMSKIYSQASRVLVWLGEAADSSNQALDEIRAAGQPGHQGFHRSNNETIQPAVLALLQRNWFRRIWILQEVAAARHILILCGSTEIDGYAFCLGIDSLREFFGSHADLQSLISSVTYLIRGAIFRTKGLPQAICTLGELIDMYHNREATKLHDKVYALFNMSGMSSDDLDNAKLSLNYGDDWQSLLQRLAKFILGEDISVETWSNKQIAVIEGKGCILGKVSSVQNTISLDGRQGVNIIFKNKPGQLDFKNDGSAYWTLLPSAKPVQDGDLICLLRGASKPTIIRLREGYFVIVMIVASPLESGQSEIEYIKWPKLFARDFLLIWDWIGQYEVEARTNGEDDKYSKKELGGCLDNENRIWNRAMILDDVGEFEKANEILREARKGYEMAFEQEHLHTPTSQSGRAPLSWAAGNGYTTVVDRLINKHKMDPDSQDSQSGQTPLSWAARNGHEVTVKWLVENSKFDIDSKDQTGRTPLSWAAENEHKAVVKLLLETGKVDVESKDRLGQKLLWWAAGSGHEAVVKLLIETGKVDVESKDQYGETPLSWAAGNGHEAVVKLLIETGKVDVESKDQDGRTPLSWAARNGHEAVVKLLIETGKVDVESKDQYGETPLSWAARNGNEAVVKLLRDHIS